jgi:hypothetical protein
MSFSTNSIFEVFPWGYFLLFYFAGVIHASYTGTVFSKKISAEKLAVWCKNLHLLPSPPFYQAKIEEIADSSQEFRS